ncbi:MULTISPECIES: sensor histidine kinase [unclassified Pseudomonas]|uniref:sensor histidine kinase n=1 Tax=unclassified Pseudomonas TaxID=196821 RepID=UPI00119B5D11|nr:MULTISPECIES: sensor histidine kinase [unclassified Pseudomonas]TWC12092.1 signal transduction histidine kinase [Pseudomonas sp. SJZ075]TWC18594.1 signal transduction histidine kinase [Pseudomonas sp. SJZ074]TWC28661.1 signal transduction histidine kinase [Pseudomonas sp. SJZ078]TWC36377.1 signal transduction histidine kinase [Pseudomonas sp. SJZ085]TWC48841.1 signal transduction histidine kinase [Pseudomonas sp. SJZ124]
MRSIQRRLSLGLIGVMVVVGLVLAQTSLWLFELGLQRYLEAGLRNDSESLLVALVRGPQGLQLDERRLSPAYLRPFSGHYFRIDFADVHWRSRSLWDQELPRLDHPGLHANLQLGPEGQKLLVLRTDYRRLGQAISISVAQDYTPVRDSFLRMQQIGLGLGLAGLLLILLLQRFTVRRALRPLERAREQIAQLQRGQRSQLDEQVPLELEPLVAQINHLLAHTEDSLKRSRNALGNLGHALKTPLAVLQSLASNEKLDPYPELRSLLLEQLEQVRQRLNRELNRARLAGDALPGAQLDCDAELPGLLATLNMIHGEHLHLSYVAAPGQHLPWDREDLLELLGNLLDNACKWADAEVRLTVTETTGTFILAVEDDGPGIPEERREQVFSRGTRLDEQTDGHGLGLGIVRDIVDTWGGTLTLHDSEWGGLKVLIELPRR